MKEKQVWSLGRKDPLENEMAIHSSTPAWKIPWTEEPDRLQSRGLQRVGHDWATSLHFTLWVYKGYGTEVSFDNDKGQKTKRTVPITKGTRDDDGHKVRRQSISQERESRLSSFVVKIMFTKGDWSLSHTMTIVPGSSVLFHLKINKGLVRNSM